MAATPSSLRPQGLSPVSLAHLATLSGARQVDDRDLTVSGIDLSAQRILPGDLFAALAGARAHGAQFVDQAIERGAVAVLTDPDGAQLVAGRLPVLVHSDPRSVLGEIAAEIYGRPSEKLQVLGITGTSGKTTTAYMTEGGLRAAGRTVGLIGTVETRFESERLPASLTTPEAPELHAIFAAMLERGADTVVMEVSSHALELGRVAGTHFAVGAFTNLSHDHLDFHETFDEYFAAKARLFAPDSPTHAATAVICIDDEWGERMAAIAKDRITIATSKDADWTAGEVTTTPDGRQNFRISSPAGQLPATIGLPGHYNIANALLAAALCTTAGVDPKAALTGIAEVAVPGRVERVDRGQDFLAVVDYAHKPAALEAVIATLRAHSEGRIAVVVGAGGDRDSAKRPVMGEVGARDADLLVITDDNPRSEDASAIRAAVYEGAIAASSKRAHVEEIGDRAEAITFAVNWAQPGDVVLVAGKGHETGQEINGVKYPFDDREVLGEALERRSAQGDTTA